MIHHLKWSFISQIGCSTISMVFTILIMNELHPDDYGLIGMIFPIFLFWELISNFALDRSIITRPNISNDELSSLFWVKLGYVTLIAIFFLLIKTVVIEFYNETRLGLIINWFAIVLIIHSITDIYKGILYSSFSFKKMAISELAAVFMSSIIALYLAKSGWSYKALIAKELFLSSLFLAFISIGSNWVPKLVFNKDNLINHWKFGKNITTARLFNYFSRNLDDILAGRKFGSNALGLYTKSYALLTLPLTIISKTFVTAVLPSMPYYNEDPNNANEKYKKVARSVLAMNTPLCLIIFFIAQSLIGLILPEGWKGTIPLIQLFCLLSIFQAIGPLNDLVYEGMDKSEKIVKYTVVCHMITISGILLGFLLGHNIFELALYYVCGNFITFIVNQYFIARITKMSLYSLLVNMVPYFICGLIAFVIIYFGRGYFYQINPIFNIFLTTSLILLIYYGSIFCFFKPNFNEIKSAVHQLFKRP